jgi:predicted Zn-dependent peptidase
MHDSDLTAATMLNNILGGPGLNSRLNLNVREKYGFAYHIESFLQPYTDTGLFGVYIGTDKGQIDKALKLILNELKKLRNEKLGVLQLSKAKKQLIGQLALSRENNINQMISLGKARINYETIDTLEELHRKISAVTASDLISVAQQMFDPNQFSYLIYNSK